MPTLSNKRFMSRANAGRNVRRRTTYSRSMPMANKAELKYATTLTTGSTSTDGFNLLNIEKGVSRNERVGDTIRVKRIEVSLPGLTGTELTKAYIYSRDGAKGQAIGLTRSVEEPDTNRYRIWATRNQKFLPQLANPASAVQGETGPSLKLSKNFSIPMKVTFDEDSMLNETLTNGIYLAWYRATQFGDSISPVEALENNTMQIRIWYYDA